MERTYDNAIKLINSRKAPAKANLDDMRGSDDMAPWLEVIGHSVPKLKTLNMIHVSGTKGKGSTCAFTSSLLQAHGKTNGFPTNIGLYTSPHIKSIRERIRINGISISEELFTTRFFEIWEKLPEKATPALDIPRYLQLLALLSFHVFILEKVDVAIYETHLGGQYDATNITRNPVVTGITTIELDHVHLLGPTIQNIAWHKAGIFKSGALAFSSSQQQSVETVLRQEAGKKKVELKFIDTNTELPSNVPALEPEVQRKNCSLALEVVRAWLRVQAPEGKKILSSDDIIYGIENFSWPGRFQQITDGTCTWFLDGAHTNSSVQLAVDWYAQSISKPMRAPGPTGILIFSHFSKRDGTELLRCIAQSLEKMKIRLQYVILTSYDERRDGKIRIDRNLRHRFNQGVQDLYVQTWKEIDPVSIVLSKRFIEEALDCARNIGTESGTKVEVLITGSLHLISGALSCIETYDDPTYRLC